MQMPFSFWKFSPLSLPNLAWWLDAGRGITIATGVSQWNDLSGNNRNATQPTAASQPALTTNAIGGFPAVTFNGTSSYMLSGMTVATFFAGNLTDTTIIAVMNSTVVVGGGCMLGSNGTTNTDWIGIYAPYTNSGTTLWDAGPFSTCRLTETVTWGSSSVAVFTRSGTTSTMYKNNTSVGSGTVSGNYQSGTAVPCLGCQDGSIGDSDTFWNGQIAEIVAYSRALTANEISIISRYWGAKYNIAQA